MVGEDSVTMSAKELRRIHLLRQVRDKRRAASGPNEDNTRRQLEHKTGHF